MVDYPVEFSSESEVENGEDKWSLETAEGLKTKMSVPEEFGGDKTEPSPEDLFSASLQTCVVATFNTIAERKGLNYGKIKSEASVRLDRGDDSRPIMKNGEITVEVTQVEDRSKAEEVADITERNCFVHNSVKTEIETSFVFND